MRLHPLTNVIRVHPGKKQGIHVVHSSVGDVHGLPRQQPPRPQHWRTNARETPRIRTQCATLKLRQLSGHSVSMQQSKHG